MDNTLPESLFVLLSWDGLCYETEVGIYEKFAKM